MEKVKITNNVPYLYGIDANHNVIEYKRVYKYFLTLDQKSYNFKRKKDLKNFLYKKIQDKTLHDVNQVTEIRVSCVVTNRNIINDVVKVHIYDLFNVTPFFCNY